MQVKSPSPGSRRPAMTPYRRSSMSKKSKSPSLSKKSSPSPEPRNYIPIASKNPNAYQGPEQVINNYSKPANTNGRFWSQDEAGQKKVLKSQALAQRIQEEMQSGGKRKSRRAKGKKSRKTYKKK
uniref:Uncharacterized protein n=1 Tax=viral metagenome TaxID=1070528 RepID=A0A6C0B934_9ZZZZ